MIWRAKGEIIFDTRGARNTFMSELAAWLLTRPTVVNRTRALDEEVDGSIVYPLPPTARLDLGVVLDGHGEELLQRIRDLPRAHVVRIFASIHRCSIDGLRDGREVRYVRWP